MQQESQQKSVLGQKRQRSETEQDLDYQPTAWPPENYDVPLVDNKVDSIKLWYKSHAENDNTQLEDNQNPFDIDEWKKDVPDLSPDNARDGYFGSYSKLAIHDMMIKDQIRTLAYQNALTREVVQNKVILDVGCGTGILSLFAAREGAKKVYAVDEAEIAFYAMNAVEANGFGPLGNYIIVVIKALIENVDKEDQGKIIPDKDRQIQEKVDILVSEWMGYGLLYEGMFKSIIAARDKFKPKQMIPSECTIMVCAFSSPECHESSFDYWHDVYGFKMPEMAKAKLLDAEVHYVDPSQCEFSSRKCIYRLDCMKATNSDLTFMSEFNLFLTQRDQKNVKDYNAKQIITGIVMYFDCVLVPGVILSTAPGNLTHWKHVRLYLENQIPYESGDILQGKIYLENDSDYERDINIVMQVSLIRNGKPVIKSKVRNKDGYEDTKYYEEKRMYKIRS